MGVDINTEKYNEAFIEDGEEIHKLTIEEIPGHTHTGRTYSTSYNNNVDIPSGRAYAKTFSTGDGNWAFNGTDSSISGGEICYMATTDNIGGDQSHNNMQPYITEYMWQRIEPEVSI